MSDLLASIIVCGTLLGPVFLILILPNVPIATRGLWALATLAPITLCFCGIAVGGLIAHGDATAFQHQDLSWLFPVAVVGPWLIFRSYLRQMEGP